MERLVFPKSPERIPEGLETARNLATILEKHQDERVLVAGVPCSGKSTLVQHIPGALDMDAELFPKLSRGEKMFAFQSVFNPETGRYEKAPHDDSDPADVEAFELSTDVLQTLAQMHLEIEPNRPLHTNGLLCALSAENRYLAAPQRASVNTTLPITAISAAITSGSPSKSLMKQSKLL